MGLCCGKSKDRFKDKSTKICGQIHSAVAPLHVSSHEPACSNSLSNLNGHLPLGRNHTTTNGMANSFTNMGITNPIKGLVSKKRNRYKQDGFNLDLTYITPNIIAMGYPASNIEGVYRNHIDDVVKFFESKHNGHYFIYNLCSERCYDKAKFNNRVKSFPFDDHNPPKIELIQPFCEAVDSWLQMDSDNVAVVHCKAGKGRTGTMICCYLLHCGRFRTADEALGYYGRTRTQDRKGVTIPSQVRYVRYYETLLRENLEYAPVAVYIKEILLDPTPTFAGGQGVLCFSISQQSLKQEGQQMTQMCTKLYKSGVYEVKRGLTNFVINLDVCTVLSGDVKVEFYFKNKLGRKERQFQFWFNTFFVVHQNQIAENYNNGYIDQNGGADIEQTYMLTLRKNELDIVNKKDKQNKVFSSDFKVTLFLRKIPKNETNWNLPRLPQDTPSVSSAEWSEAELDSTEEGWESGMAEAINPMPCVDNEHNMDTLIRATQIFEQRCLPEFVVARVVADKCLGNTPCRWEVWYKYRNPQQLYEGGEYARRLVRRFDAVKPERTNILKPPISLTTVINDGPCYKIRYGVICECICDDIPFFGINDDGPFDISEISAY